MNRKTVRSAAATGLGHPPVRAAVLGCATAAQVVGGLGTDHGDYDLDAVERFAESAETMLWEEAGSPA